MKKREEWKKGKRRKKKGAEDGDNHEDKEKGKEAKQKEGLPSRR